MSEKQKLKDENLKLFNEKCGLQKKINSSTKELQAEFDAKVAELKKVNEEFSELTQDVGGLRFRVVEAETAVASLTTTNTSLKILFDDADLIVAQDPATGEGVKKGIDVSAIYSELQAVKAKNMKVQDESDAKLEGIVTKIRADKV